MTVEDESWAGRWVRCLDASETSFQPHGIYRVTGDYMEGIRIEGRPFYERYNKKRFVLLPFGPSKVKEGHALLSNASRLNENGVPPQSTDAVNRPSHYARFKIEPIHFIMENNLEFWQGNVIKYTLRWDGKDGLQDLKKARRYLDMQIKKMEGDPKWSE